MFDNTGYIHQIPPQDFVYKTLAFPSQIRVAYASDLHLDFGKINPEFFTVDAEVLILAGDVGETRLYADYDDFFRRCSEKFSLVILVFGNHEYYGSSIEDARKQAEQTIGKYGNIRILQNESIEYQGVEFVGATLWTDIGKDDPLGKWHLKQKMNDYRVINFTARRLRPEDTIAFHKVSVEFIDYAVIEAKIETKNVVVITHHAPSFQSIHPAYVNDSLGNLGYASELSEFILQNDDTIKHWIHGHIHNKQSYRVGNCWVHNNSRGYPGERPGSLPPYVPEVFTVSA